MADIPGWYIAWSFTGDKEKQAMDEIVESGSQRTIGILAAAMLENRLKGSILSRLVTDDEAIVKDMFRESGALGTFAAKIRLGYLLGMYSESGRKDLEYIKNIRNRFAHNLTARDFNCQEIKPLVMNLKIVERQVREYDGWGTDRPLPELKDPFPRFMWAVNSLLYALLVRHPHKAARPLF